jgi:hypothetical protein
MPPPREGKLRPSKYPPLFRRILASVLKIFRGEQQRLLDSGFEVVDDLIEELIRYAYNEKPFQSRLWTRKSTPLEWWEGFASDSNASLLSVCYLHPFFPEISYANAQERELPLKSSQFLLQRSVMREPHPV